MVPGGSADDRAPGDPLSESPRVHVIFNPASGRGRGKRRIERYRELLTAALPGYGASYTSRAGEECDLADRAIDDGADVVVAVGGDGTWSHVADRVLASGRDDIVFGMLPNGTGNDFGRSLGLPRDPQSAVRVLAAGHVRRVDAGHLRTPTTSEGDPGRTEPCHFLNLLGFGFDIAVIDAAARARLLKGELLYKVTALQQLFRFPGLFVTVRGASGMVRAGPHLMLTISNGRFFGGGFPIAPTATVDDGLLHACRIGDAAPLTRLRLFNLAERGRHTTHPRVEILSEPKFEIELPGPARFEVDGDVRTSPTPVLSAEILPRALRVVVPLHSAKQST